MAITTYIVKPNASSRWPTLMRGVAHRPSRTPMYMGKADRLEARAGRGIDPRAFPAPPFSSEAKVGVGISERVAPAQTFKSPTRQAHLPVWARAAQRHGRLGGSASPIRPLPVLPRGGSGLLRTPA